jgi:hypothetical protein
MRTSDSIEELATALAKAQGKIEAAPKDSANPFFKSHYADLASVWGACRIPLSENGLAIVQSADSQEGFVDITTRLIHSSGQWIEGTLRLIPTKSDPQGFGSAITYGRRYGLSAIVGIVADEDDDGNAASGPAANGKAKAKTETKPAEPPGRAEFLQWLAETRKTHPDISDDFVQATFNKCGKVYPATRAEIEKTLPKTERQPAGATA